MIKRLCILFLILHAIVAWPHRCFCQVEHLGNIAVFRTSDTDKVVFDISPEFNGQPLILGSQFYVDEHGDTLYIDALRFYLTNISFTGYDNALNTNSFLYDAADSDTHSFVIKKIPGGNYSILQFTVGVDSIANTSGANDGDLDPVHGMYWAWNSGYIMARLEGRASVCRTLHHAFEFHIGGYKHPFNTARVVALRLPPTFAIGKRGIPVISLKVDVSAFFTQNLDLAKVNNIVTPGREASSMADKYAKMFSIETVDYLSCKK